MFRTLSCCLLLVASLQAATKTYSNFTSKFDVSRLGPVPIGTFGGQGPYVFATQFTAGTAGELDNVEFAVFPGMGSSAVVALYTDNGNLPGSQLESFTGTIEAATGNTPDVVVRGHSQKKTALQAGTKYWIVISAANPTTDFFEWGAPGRHVVPGLTVFQLAGSGWMAYAPAALTLIVTVN